MSDAGRLCTATSKRTGKRCRANVFRKPDGSRTTTCYFHSGGHQLREPGDPRNGGQPRTSGLYAELLPRGIDDAFLADARARLGTLDDELVLLRANLADLGRRADAAEERGELAEAQRLRDFSGEHVDRISRTEERRARVLETLQRLEDPPLPPGAAPGDDVELEDEDRAALREKLLRDVDE